MFKKQLHDQAHLHFEMQYHFCSWTIPRLLVLLNLHNFAAAVNWQLLYCMLLRNAALTAYIWSRWNSLERWFRQNRLSSFWASKHTDIRLLFLYGCQKELNVLFLRRSVFRMKTLYIYISLLTAHNLIFINWVFRNMIFLAPSSC